mmetsp:Transcript_15435/g.19645  ORF Transcript_15435/g.19645 Transcript_15435/m.19645 type:complete len:224 (-) Transcript_15435:347-1018(-)
MIITKITQQKQQAHSEEIRIPSCQPAFRIQSFSLLPHCVPLPDPPFNSIAKFVKCVVVPHARFPSYCKQGSSHSHSRVFSLKKLKQAFSSLLVTSRQISTGAVGCTMLPLCTNSILITSETAGRNSRASVASSEGGRYIRSDCLSGSPRKTKFTAEGEVEELGDMKKVLSAAIAALCDAENSVDGSIEIAILGDCVVGDCAVGDGGTGDFLALLEGGSELVGV